MWQNIFEKLASHYSLSALRIMPMVELDDKGEVVVENARDVGGGGAESGREIMFFGISELYGGPRKEVLRGIASGVLPVAF